MRHVLVAEEAIPSSDRCDNSELTVSIACSLLLCGRALLIGGGFGLQVSMLAVYLRRPRAHLPSHP